MSKSPVPRWDALGSGQGFRSTTTAWDLRWWILAAVSTSIVVHAGLFVALKRLRLPSRSVVEEMTASPQTGVFEIDLEQVTIRNVPSSPDLTPEAPDLTRKTELPPPTNLPDISELAEAIKDRAVVLTPSISTPAANLTLSKPVAGTAGDLLDDPADVRQSLDGSLKDSLLSKPAAASPSAAAPDADQLLIDSAANTGSADLKGDVLKSLKKGTGGNGGIDGFSSLDDLANFKGPIAGDFKAMLRTDLLFDFGSSRLREEARISLMKLGAIIQSNAAATFRLIGHTDTIGDEASNQTLSEARAQAVKDWLVGSLRLDGANIVVEGRGERETLPDVDPNGSAATQQPNRRVEIHKTGG
jgi:outer membrane protein OmpA-like peptidoglycan-associated protein